MNHKLLFICTGNYYRSRYAEAYFNVLAEKQNLNWSAFSRGLAVGSGSGNVGPIYPQVTMRLRKHGFSLESEIRFPLQLIQADLQAADLVVALYEPEHRPLMQQRFPAWADRITYWQVPDLDIVGTETAFPLIEEKVLQQIQQFRQSTKNQ